MNDELPPGWMLTTLGEVAEIHDSRRVPLNQAQRAVRPGPYPYYGANGQVGTIDDFLFEGDHILLAEDGGYFDDPFRPNAYAVTGRFWVNNHAHILRAGPAISHKLLLHALNATDLMPYVNGTTRLKLTQADMRRIPIVLPPLAEQHRIVPRIEALFARTDRTRTDLVRTAQLAERHMSAALAAAFRGEVPTTLKSVDVGSPPLVPLASIVESLRYGTAQKCSPEPHGTAVLRIPNVAHGRVDLSDLKYGALDRAELERLRLRVGDILIIRSNGSPTLVGRPALVGPEAEGLAFAGYLIRARPRLDRVVPAYLALMLQAPQIRDHIEINARSSSGVHNINSEELGALQVPMPPIEQQRAIVERLESERARAVRLRNESTRSLALLDRLERSILTRAFRGELVPQDRDDEPAIAQLERLRHDPATAVPRRSRQPKMPDTEALGAPRTKGPAVPKSRTDADVRGRPYLADRLRQIGSAATAEDLYRAADLPIADFYKQLSEEVAKGWVKDASGKLEAA